VEERRKKGTEEEEEEEQRWEWERQGRGLYKKRGGGVTGGGSPPTRRQAALHACVPAWWCGSRPDGQGGQAGERMQLEVDWVQLARGDTRPLSRGGGRLDDLPVGRAACRCEHAHSDQTDLE
jgi:hypothetical protein